MKLRKVIARLFLAISCLTCQAVEAQTAVDKEVYVVKKKDTLFGIAKAFDMSITDLMDYNPIMKSKGYELKAGTYLIVPKKGKANTTHAANNSGKEAKNKAKDATLRIGIMLPLHDRNGDGKRMVEYYRGFLLACDSLRTKGISTHIRAWNVDDDTDIRQTLDNPEVAACNMIVGPLYTSKLKPLADFCKARNIRLVIPFSIEGDEVVDNAQIYQVYQSPDKLNNAAIDAFLRRFENNHVVIIDCNDPNSNKFAFTAGLRNALENKKIPYNITNLKSDEVSFAKAFSRTKNNVVVLNTGRSPELTIALTKLNGLATALSNIKIQLFGYTDWLMYTQYNLENFFKFDTYIPSTFFYNPLAGPTKSFEKKYASWFHGPMQTALPRFAMTGFDHAMFFVNGLKRYGEKFNGSQNQKTNPYLQTPLWFKQVAANGGWQNQGFMLIHYTPKYQIETIVFK